jgi:lactate dehydrogenase-like 2-hydroxyacid dehydrogenase
MSIDVLALVRVPPDRHAALTAAKYTVHEAARSPDRAEAIRRGGAAIRAVLTNGRGGLTADEMARLPNLELICATGAGYEAVDMEAARQRGIAVANCPGTNAAAVADSAMMLLLASTRHLLAADRFVRDGGWQDQWKVETPRIFGKRLGLLGLGRIGSQIAHRAAGGFDMAVGYHSRTPVADAPYRYFERLVDLAGWADFLVVAAPGGAGTRHLVDREVLDALGPDGYLVNVGRGTIVDTAAVLEALRARTLGGVALDVLEGEPSFPPHALELLQFPNATVTPHCAGRAPESRAAATALIVEILDAHFSGEPLPTAILPGRTRN